MGLPECVAAVAILPDSRSPSDSSERSGRLGQDTGRQVAQIELPRLRRVRQDVREGKPAFSPCCTDPIYSRMALPGKPED